MTFLTSGSPLRRPSFFRNLRGNRRWVSSGQLFLPRDVVIVGAARTPIGSFCGGLSSLAAPHLGAAAIGAALRKGGVEPEEVDGLYMGHALTAGCGQNPARQAAVLAGLPPLADCVGINKACASGLKAVMLAAQAIALGHMDVVVAGGMENMSQAPYLLREVRNGGYHFGDGCLEDSALSDGLRDVGSGLHLGACVEQTARELGISRHDQDLYAIESYTRAASAWQQGLMDAEVTPLRVRNTSSDSLDPKTLVVGIDEEYSRLRMDAVAGLSPVFDENGSVTAASASSLNDGAAALVLTTIAKAQELDLLPLARICAFADHGQASESFATAPSNAVRQALRNAGMSSVDFHEIHESFAVVPLANMASLGLDSSRVNINGGGLALGHPLGASGARILCTLMNVLAQQNAETGCASIANGGGAASAMILERL